MRICSAPGCGYPVFGTDKTTKKGYCKKHQYLRTDLKGQISKKRFNENFQYDNPYGFKNESEMYRYILQKHGSRSWLSKKDIKNPKPINFAHILPKGIGKYPHFRLNPNYCILVTDYEHWLIDFGTEKQREEYAKVNPEVDWNRFHKLEKQAKEEYKRKYNN